MWKPTHTTYKHIRYIDKSLLYQLSGRTSKFQARNFNDGQIESRYQKSKSGWFSRRGTRPGYPSSWPTSRVVGVDLNLQVISYLHLASTRERLKSVQAPRIII